MRMIGMTFAAVSLIAVTATPSSAVAGAAESTWSDSPSSSTLVTESNCAGVSGPSPYNYQCTWTAIADNTLNATPPRGMCTEVLASAGSRTLGGPCGAKFSITMKVHRQIVDRVLTCNGTSLNQMTTGPEPRPLRGNFQYESTDGFFRTVPVDVNVTNNVVTFQGSVARVEGEQLVDEVKGSFRVACQNGSRTTGRYAGEYKFVF